MNEMEITSIVVGMAGILCLGLLVMGIFLGVDKRDDDIGIKLAMFGLVTPILSLPFVAIAMICDLLI